MPHGLRTHELRCPPGRDREISAGNRPAAALLTDRGPLLSRPDVRGRAKSLRTTTVSSRFGCLPALIRPPPCEPPGPPPTRRPTPHCSRNMPCHPGGRRPSSGPCPTPPGRGNLWPGTAKSPSIADDTGDDQQPAVGRQSQPVGRCVRNQRFDPLGRRKEKQSPDDSAGGDIDQTQPCKSDRATYIRLWSRVTSMAGRCLRTGSCWWLADDRCR